MSELPRMSDPTTDSAIRLIRRLADEKTDGPIRAFPSERFFARLIDFCVVGGVGLGLDVGVLFVSTVVLGLEQRNEEFELTRAGRATTSIGFAAVLAVGAAYEVGLTASRAQTLGKRRALRVVLTGGGTVGPARSTIRFATWALPWSMCLAAWVLTFPDYPMWSLVFFTGAFGSLGLMAWVFRDEDGRGIHDRVAGTRVIAEK